MKSERHQPDYVRSNLIAWLLYDAGNSFIALAVSSLYLSQWLVLERHVPELWYGTMFSIATVIVLVTSPAIGTWSDKVGKRAPFLIWFTAVIFVASLLLVVVAITPAFLPVAGGIALVLFLVIQYAYQMSFVFFNALIHTLSSAKTRGSISGLSMLSGQLAFVLANVVLLFFATGKVPAIGLPGRAQAFLPALVVFAVCSLPMLWFWEPKKETKKLSGVKTSAVLSETWRGIRALFIRDRNVGLFLVGFSFVSDGILTISLYFALVLNTLYRVNDFQKAIIMALMFLCAGIGGFVFGKIADRIGMKAIVITSSLLMIGGFSLAFVGLPYPFLFVVSVFAGLGWGGFYAIARTMLLVISPKDRLGEYYGFYSTFERFASIIGPTLWSVVFLSLAGQSKAMQYRAAGFAEIALMVAGVFILLKVKEK